MGNVVPCNTKEELIETPPIEPLTADDIEAIKKSWAMITIKPYDYGEKILYRYFESYPKNLERFESFKHTPILMLKGTPGFRAHASRIVNIISSVVDSLDKDPELTTIKKILSEVGKSHYRRKISKQSFNELRLTLADFLSEFCHLDEQGKASWVKANNLIENVIFECLDGRSEQFER